MVSNNLKDYLDTAVRLAKDAGYMMLSKAGKNTEINAKTNFADLVTETDKAIENYVFGQLRTLYTDHEFIGEENFAGQVELTNKPTWIIDPIDGTLNYIHQVPFYCISIALIINKELVLGVIYSPALNKLYTAIKGEGAYLNGQRIRTKPTKTFNEAILIIELGCGYKHKDPVIQNYLSFAWKVQGIRGFGSAALDICFVAEGVCDVYYEMGIHCWDIAAGAIILQEAGGFLTDTNQNQFDLFNRRILAASTPELSKLVSSNLKFILDFESDIKKSSN